VANNDKVGNLISQNDDLHRFGETKEEWFVGVIRDLVLEIGDGSLTPEVHETLWERCKRKQTAYGEVVAQKPIVDMILASWPLKDYYGHTDLYKPSMLRKWLGTSAAVSTIQTVI
jgi:hypothetical protein